MIKIAGQSTLAGMNLTHLKVILRNLFVRKVTIQFDAKRKFYRVKEWCTPKSHWIECYEREGELPEHRRNLSGPYRPTYLEYERDGKKYHRRTRGGAAASKLKSDSRFDERVKKTDDRARLYLSLNMRFL